MILRQDGSSIVRFRDVGRVELGAANERTILKRDGIPMVGVVLRPQPGSNHIDIVDEFHRRVEGIRGDLPPDIRLGIGFDNTQYIRSSISEVQQTIFLAMALVIAIIFLFLRDWRTAVIPVLVIPVSLVGAFFVMYAAGFSISVLTLLAIVLAIGLVVDDAIVVLENVYAKIEGGMEPAEAGREGTREIFFAVIATTVSLAAVFLPILFLSGLTGRLFREFGVTLAGAVIISSFVALTLTPMLSVRLLRKRERQPWFHRRTEPFFRRVNAGYERSLDTFLAQRWLALPALLLAGGLAYVLWNALPSELAPLEDRGQMRMVATAPEGATFEYMEAYMDRLVNETGQAAPERAGIISITSPGFGASSSVNTGFGMVILRDRTERERSQAEIADALSRVASGIPGARVFVSQPATIGGARGGGLPVQFVLQATNLEELREALPRFMEAARQQPEFAFVDVNLKFDRPELQVQIDRDRAQSLGVSVRDISRTLQLALSGQRYGYFIRDGKQYDVIGQVGRDDRSRPDDLSAFTVRTASGEPVSLGNLARIEEGTTPPQLFRFDRYVSATVSAQLAPGASIAEGIEAMRRTGREVLPPSFQTSLDGEAREFEDGSGGLLVVFGLALVLIYLVLAAQFESFRDPLIILLTVPLALSGALLSLWYFDQTLNIFSQIGMIMLIGLVTKNGILIVEFANQRMDAGLRVEEAIREAAAARFRPILMTALSTIFGILPIALALGSGAESRVPMGIAVVGGMIIGTALSLYVVPAVYTFLTSRPAAPRDERADAERGPPPWEEAPRSAPRPELVGAGADRNGSGGL